MVLPPTGLTSLLYEEKDAPAMYERLRREKCLSAEALRRGPEVIALMAAPLERGAERGPHGEIICGPSAVDEVARALLQSGFLSPRGEQLSRGGAATARARAWWRFWE